MEAKNGAINYRNQELWLRGKKRGCTDKMAYPSSGLAAIAAQHIMATSPDTLQMSAYLCPFECGHWHLSRQIRYECSETHLVIDRQEVKAPKQIKAVRREKLKAQYLKRQATYRAKGIGVKARLGITW